MALARTHTVIARGGLPFLVAALLSIGGGIYCFFLFRSDSYTTKMSQRVLQSKSIAGAKVSSTVYVENDIRFVDIGQLEPLIYQEVN